MIIGEIVVNGAGLLIDTFAVGKLVVNFFIFGIMNDLESKSSYKNSLYSRNHR